MPYATFSAQHETAYVALSTRKESAMDGRNRSKQCPVCGLKLKRCTCPKGFRTLLARWWMHIAAILVIVGMAVIVVNCMEGNEGMLAETTVAETDTKEPRRGTLREQLLDWPLPPTPPTIADVDKMPDVPTGLPLVRMVNGSADQDDLARRLQVLVRYHPEPEIHNELARLFEQRTVRFADLQTGYGGMAFGVSGDQPQIHVFTPWLIGLAGVDGVLEGMLTIYHEFQHFKQWREDREDWEHGGQIPQSRVDGWCTRTYFEREREAYERHCRLAKQWGALPTFSGLCEWVDTPQFPQAVFLWQVHSVPENVIEVCGAHMARAAGHQDFQ